MASYEISIEKYTPTISLVGILEPKQQTMVSAKTAGRISYLNVELGDRVTTNQLLGALSGDEIRSMYNTAQADRESALNAFDAQKSLLDQQVESAKKILETAVCQRICNLNKHFSYWNERIDMEC